MQLSVKLLMNILYAEILRKNKEKSFASKSEYWMRSKNDEDYWRLSHENYIVKMFDDNGLEDEVKKLNTMPFHLGVFVF